MANNRNNPNQLQLDFDRQIEEYTEVKTGLLDAASSKPTIPLGIENEMEACIEIAAVIKRTVRECGLSRDQLLDGINAYFGRSDEGAEKDPPECRKPLTIHMLNNYLSKPCEYPIPAYYLYAIHHVTGIIEPAATIVAAAGGQVATAEEIRLLQIGKLEQTIDELHRLRRDMRGKGKR
ncbi:MAG TPA: hypothetical protein VJ995_00330 [Geothermobacteraceae bacterium]|nr:hypothetical protein [Geothermobacteraceae bacterium]